MEEENESLKETIESSKLAVKFLADTIGLPKEKKVEVVVVEVEEEEEDEEADDADDEA